MSEVKDGSRYHTPHSFTIYPAEQGVSRNAELEVKLQRSFVSQFAIPSSLADKKCSSLGVRRLLNLINGLMKTSVDLSTPLRHIFEYYISRDFDFGLVYCLLRRHWQSDFATLMTRLQDARVEDAVLRRDALDPSGEYVTTPDLPPRRVWDLRGNRVIPYWYLGDIRRHEICAVSHSWVADDERSSIHTPINGFQWPVPVPNDSSLERVRIELLNKLHIAWPLGYQYAWLDVLCNRQVGEEGDEDARLHEWKTDVPTIGDIYRERQVLVYFNGLGRPFRNGGYNNPRHWFNRAWTVQEAASRGPLIGGETPSSPDFSDPGTIYCDPEFREFFDHFLKAFSVAGVRTAADQKISQAICIMRERHATKELDRISGLVGLAAPEKLLAYDTTQSSEEAWGNLLTIISPSARANIFFWYPVAGNTEYLWAPSWSQAMERDIPADEVGNGGSSEIHYDEAKGVFFGRDFRVADNCRVLGLGSVGKYSGGSVERRGTIHRINPLTKGGQRRRVIAKHQVLIDETDLYTAVMNKSGSRIVLGTRNDDGYVEKLCVLDFLMFEDEDLDNDYDYGDDFGEFVSKILCPWVGVGLI